MSNLNEYRYLIIYHKEDNDGLFSMAIIYNYFVNEIKCDDLNSISDEDIKSWKESFDYIIITDICFNNTKRMIELKNMFEDRFVWIDHHAPIINESLKLKFDDVNGERNASYSALLNAYKYYYDQFNVNYNKGECPEILRILSAYDSWTYEREGYTLDYVMSVNKGVTYTFKLDPQKVIDFVYKLIYTVTTINGLVVSSPTYRVTAETLLAPSKNLNILPRADSETGSIKINFKKKKKTVKIENTIKEFKLGSGNTMSWKEYKSEALKCMLVCSNCHKEIHSKLGYK